MNQKIRDWLTQEISIITIEKKRTIWFTILLSSSLAMAIIFYILFSFFSWAFAGSNTILFFLASIMVVLISFLTIRIFNPSYQIFLIFTLLVSAITFAVEKYLLMDEVFPPFSTRTTISLYFSFSILALAIFYQRIPAIILAFFPAIYLFGFYICLGFILVLLPIMLFGWILIPFMGLGFLPYSPLLAASGFLIALIKIHTFINTQKKPLLQKTNKIALVFTGFAIVFYSGWYMYQWQHCNKLLENQPETTIGHNQPLQDLPSWVKIGMNFPRNHVSEQFLQPRRTVGRTSTFFQTSQRFDPLAYMTSQIFSTDSRFHQDKIQLLKLLFGYTHTDLERLWSGDSLITQRLSHHIQIYPQAGIAYTELTIDVHNEKNRTEEAIYTLTFPPGSIATKLSLWIGGKEQFSRLSLKSKAKNAYRKIVGVERRDPALLEWLPSGKFRLRVFPIAAQQKRTVRVGVVSFLENKQKSYTPARIEGVPFVDTREEVYIDLFSKKEEFHIVANGIHLKEKIVSDGEVRQWHGSSPKPQRSWSFHLKGADNFSRQTSFQLGSENYRIQPAVYQTIPFSTDKIYLVLNDSKTYKQWQQVYQKLAEKHRGKAITLYGQEKLTTKDPQKAFQFIKQTPLPKYNLFPFYLLEPSQKNLIVMARDSLSIAWTELKGSEFYRKNEKFFGQNQKPVYIAGLDTELSEYIQSFMEWQRVLQITNSEKELYQLLDTSELSLPIINDHTFFFPRVNLSIIQSQTPIKKAEGPDLIARLAYYQILMSKLGKEYFQEEQDYSKYLKLAEDGYFVSPISSLVVLETEKDYKRFGIEKNQSKLGQSKIKPPGIVPEPEEWLLFIICLIALIFFYRNQLTNFCRRLY